MNATGDAFGNGIFDGYSIATGHEYFEAVTDPDNYFRCRTAGTTWSNEAFDAGKDGCAVSR